MIVPEIKLLSSSVGIRGCKADIWHYSRYESLPDVFLLEPVQLFKLVHISTNRH